MKNTIALFSLTAAKLLLLPFSAKISGSPEGGLYEIHTLYWMIITQQPRFCLSFREKSVLLQTKR